MVSWNRSTLKALMGSLIIMLSASLACGPTLPFLGPATEPPPDSGVGLEGLDTYDALFEATFTPDNAQTSGWTYQLKIVATRDDFRRALTIDGVSESKDPGDTTLTRVGDSQYLTGEGVGGASCLIFPKEVDLASSFLLPGSFIDRETLKSVWKASGDAEVAGRNGSAYTFDADTLGDFTDVSGQIVVTGDTVLSYDFAGHTIDKNFTEEGGRLSWHYEVISFSPTEPPVAPDNCVAEYPIMPDATGLTRLPGLITYKSNTPAADVVTFYQTGLESAGWGVVALPKVDEAIGVTILSYAKGGEILNVSVKTVDNGVEVKLFTEDKQVQP